MKATGIVRRVDDLGRIVIPKEIRRTLKIREGDAQLVRILFLRQPQFRSDCLDLVALTIPQK